MQFDYFKKLMIILLNGRIFQLNDKIRNELLNIFSVIFFKLIYFKNRLFLIAQNEIMCCISNGKRYNKRYNKANDETLLLVVKCLQNEHYRYEYGDNFDM